MEHNQIVSSSLERILLASQAEFCAVLEGRLAALEKRMQDCEAESAALVGISDGLAMRALALSSRGPAPSSWVFDARMPNVYFTGVYDPETISSGAKRWVDAAGRIGTKLLLDRRFQYHVEVSVVDFASPEVEASFRLVVDGGIWPWLKAESGSFSTIVAEAPNETSLDFALEVDPEAIPAKGDVSFSISRIAFSRAG